MDERPLVLVHGATGFTGRLVCAALARRGVGFAVSGRSREKLEALAKEFGAREVCVVDLGVADSIHAAIEGRRIVCACAGPFAEIGESVLATCAKLGVHYVDTTGEQRFVADAVKRYMATAEASGACIVPGMAYEIAPADWGAHLCAARAGGAPDSIAIVYATRSSGGYSSMTSRGTKLSALGMVAERGALQYVNGALVHEPTAEVVGTFPLNRGKFITAASFPSPEAVVVPSHTGARTVRTFMAMSRRTARALHATRHVMPWLVRAGRPLLERIIRTSALGPEGEGREASFQIIIEARKAGVGVHVHVIGKDPYGLTAEIQAHAVQCALRGEVQARGVVAPSVGYDANVAFAALASFGVEVA